MKPGEPGYIQTLGKNIGEKCINLGADSLPLFYAQGPKGGLLYLKKKQNNDSAPKKGVVSNE
jgi:hypothetical protein